LIFVRDRVLESAVGSAAVGSARPRRWWRHLPPPHRTAPLRPNQGESDYEAEAGPFESSSASRPLMAGSQRGRIDF